MSKGKNKAKAQEPEAQPEAKPEITLADIAGMVKGLTDETRQSVGALGERLTKLETTPAPKAASAPKAKAAPKAAIPHSEELGMLKGICKPVAQSIVEAHYRKGKPAMGAYCAKLAEFQTNPEKPSPRYAYAKALYATMGK